MEGFGAFLKHERELRGVTLREVAQVTKISTHNLELLEAERFEELGGEIFIRGFLRSYARYLGLDAADLIHRYEEQCGRTLPTSYEGNEESDAVLLANENPRQRWPMAAVGAALVVAFFAWFSWDGQDGNVPEGASRQASYPLSVTHEVAPEPVTAVTVEPVSDETPDEPADVPVVEPEAIEPGVNLVIRARQVTWMQIWIDGGPPLERELPVGYEWSLEADEQIEILTGNAAGIRLELNGEGLPLLGAEGQVRRRVITADGVFAP